MKVTCERRWGWVKVFINDYLHFQFKWSELVAIHSWNEEEADWYIRLTLKDGEILLDYDTKEKWLMILAAINQL